MIETQGGDDEYLALSVEIWNVPEEAYGRALDNYGRTENSRRYWQRYQSHQTMKWQRFQCSKVFAKFLQICKRKTQILL
jgi:hypothetical protein